MRTPLLALTGVLALTACGPKAATNDNVAVATGDNMTVLPGENEMAGTNTAMAPAASTETFLSTAAMSDMYEVAAGKIAATKATNPDLRKFAQEMVTAHTATTAALKAAITKDGVSMTPPAKPDAKHQALLDALNAAGKGAAFDDLYKRQQSDAHSEALGLMQGYAATGDKPAIRSFAADTAPKVQMHIDMLGKIG